MPTMSSFSLTDNVDYPQAAHINNLRAASFRGEYVNAETLNANKTLTDADTPIQYLTPATLSRDVTFPTLATTNHPFLIYNVATTLNLNIKNSGGTTIDVLAPGEHGHYVNLNNALWIRQGGNEYSLQLWLSSAGTGVSPADATTYVFSPFPSYGLATTAASHKLRIPRAGTIRRIYIDGICTVGSAETSTINLRLNDTTNTAITTTAAFNASPIAISNTNLAIALQANDYINISWTTPTWVTNPTALSMAAVIWIA